MLAATLKASAPLNFDDMVKTSSVLMSRRWRSSNAMADLPASTARAAHRNASANVRASREQSDRESRPATSDSPCRATSPTRKHKTLRALYIYTRSSCELRARLTETFVYIGSKGCMLHSDQGASAGKAGAGIGGWQSSVAIAARSGAPPVRTNATTSWLAWRPRGFHVLFNHDGRRLCN